VRVLLLSPVCFVIMIGGAAAETSIINYSQGSDSVLLPPVGAVGQPALSHTGTSNTASGALSLKLGKFSTQLEGAAISTLSTSDSYPFGNLPTSGNTAATSVMLNELYEITNGSWHLKPFVGGGFGFVNGNSQVLGETQTDWQKAYQLHSGVQVGFSEKLFGAVEYRWTMGSKPGFFVAGIPAKLDISQHGFTIGFDYKY
jgi:opacity protein-like surface antigen